MFEAIHCLLLLLKLSSKSTIVVALVKQAVFKMSVISLLVNKKPELKTRRRVFLFSFSKRGMFHFKLSPNCEQSVKFVDLFLTFALFRSKSFKDS